MQTIKHFITIFIVALFAVTVAPTQAQQRATSINQTISEEARRIIDDASLSQDICCHRVVCHRLRLEQELRDTLREIRRAIDAWHQACQIGLVGPLDRRVDDQCYPPTLEALVEGIRPPNTNGIIRFLRRIPRDPITGKAEWGLRSIQDARDSMTWGGQNVYDVYSKSDGTALDGTKYKDW